MAETQTPQAESIAFQAEMKQLLHLIVHSLYTHEDVFLRELISNASDALNKLRFRSLTDANVLDADAEHRINIALNAEEHTLTITDSGIGMTRDDLTSRLGTIASSGTKAFLEQLKQGNKAVDGQMIGQFGVGFYAAFMVANRIVVDTRHADPDSEAWRWTSDGEGTYTVEPSDQTSRGTSIKLFLKEEAKEYSEVERVKAVIRKYSNFVDFPIYVADEQANTVKALWRKNKSEITDEAYAEFYKFIANDYQDPLDRLHLHIEGTVLFDALLFLPQTAPMNLFREEYDRRMHLYAAGVYIQDNAEGLLPEYLRFVRGVVDTEDLPLNVSREVTQKSPVMARINKILTGKVLGWLADMAEKDAAKYKTFFEQFGALFKTGLGNDFTNREKITELLRFESTTQETGALTSLKDYVGRMPEDQKEIYFLMGENRDTVLRNPNLEYFRKHGIEVLLLTDPVDVFTMPSVTEYDGKPLKSIEKADLDLKADADDDASVADKLDTGEVNHLIALFKETLGDKVEDVIVSKRLVDSVATLVVGQQGMDAQMERMMKLMNQDFAGGKKVLEVNMDHPLLKNMAKLREEGGQINMLQLLVHQIYEGTLLIDGNLSEPTTFVQRMADLLVKATS